MSEIQERMILLQEAFSMNTVISVNLLTYGDVLVANVAAYFFTVL
jgi:hypothetical protein